MKTSFIGVIAAAGLALAPAGGWAQAQESAREGPRLQSAAEALAQDAGEYASRFQVPVFEAMRRLRAQEASVAATDSIQARYRDRLAGISIEHSPDYRIVVLLTGSDPVPDQRLSVGGTLVPVLFRTGALATREQIAGALSDRQPDIRTAFPDALGMGLDQRTGELVLMMRGGGLGEEQLGLLEAELAAVAGVPARIRLIDGGDTNLRVEGGARLVGVDPADGRSYACTTGFVVTDGTRTGITTAAHCPDAATYVGPDGARVPLDFVGQWGVGYQDVQVHVTDRSQGPFFYADGQRKAARTLTSRRSRTSTRSGDVVCHRGESSGYSCSTVELTHFAPPGDLCAGPCTPVWVTVDGPSCKNGDSGGPVFNGTTAFGIAKGGSYSGGRCRYYYYMSTDYLPEGWTLLTGAADLPRQGG